MRNGLYDVTASIQVDDDDMDADEHVFECELSIPEANYTVKQALYVSLGKLIYFYYYCFLFFRKIKWTPWSVVHHYFENY